MPFKKRYNSLMIVLHWGMAVGILMMLGSGIYMEYFNMDNALKFKIFQWHKSGGVLLLIALAIRILIRLLSALPPLPQHFNNLEKRLAHAGHMALYVAMIAMTLSGWVMVSSSIYGLPTIVFGWFQWPHIPNISANELWNSTAKTVHFYGFIFLATLIVGHVGAVIGHYKKDKTNLIKRIWWKQ